MTIVAPQRGRRGIASPVLAGLLGVGLLAGPAQGAVTTFASGAPLTRLCAAAAKGPAPVASDARFCTRALEGDGQVGRELAGLYVNRGVIEMRTGALAPALADFEAAVEVDPRLGEAYVNRGAARLARGDARGAVSDLNLGLDLRPEDPAKAYYNRGLARERLGDAAGAYEDYTRAADLAPDWSLPRNELTRFRVTRRDPAPPP